MKIHLFLILAFFLNFYNCISLKEYELKISKNIRYSKLESVSLRINNQIPNINNKFEKKFIHTFQEILAKDNIKLNLNQENGKDEISINVLWMVDENYKAVIHTEYSGYNKKIVSYLNIPKVEAEFKVYQTGDNIPILSIKKSYLGDHNSVGDNSYTVEKYELIAPRIANFYAKILTNTFKEPDEIPGTWASLFYKTSYTFTQEDNIYLSKHESPIFENFVKKKEKITTICIIPKEFIKRGSIQIYNGTIDSKSFFVDSETTIDRPTIKKQFFILGNMMIIYNPDHEQNDEFQFADYLIKDY